MKTQSLSFIGGGRITKIILQAFKNSGITFNKVMVYDINSDTLNKLKASFPSITTTSDNLAEVVKAEVVILAVHPPVTVETLEKIKGSIDKNAVLVSLVPKITIEKTSAILGGMANIARMNPSASAFVNKGVNPIAFSASFDKQKKEQLMDLLKPLGNVFEISDSKIEAYAVISAMGHTYFNFQLQKLKELALSYGMEDAEAQKAISNMLWGTTETLFNSGLSYAEVIDLVPVKPMSEVEETIKGYYDQYLNAIYNKIKP